MLDDTHRESYKEVYIKLFNPFPQAGNVLDENCDSLKFLLTKEIV